MSENLIERLRKPCEPGLDCEAIRQEGADALEKLEAELRIKEAALEHCRELGRKEIEKLQLALIARDALGGKDE